MPPFVAVYEAQLIAVLIVFARIGTALMFLPGFGEAQIPGRHRLVLGFILSLALRPSLPVVLPDTPLLLAAFLFQEIIIGLYLGLSARILFTALHILGAVMSHTSSLANAMAAGNVGYESSTALTSLMLMAGVALVFITDSHHLMLRGLYFSYELIPPTQIRLDDLALQMARLATRSLYLAAMLGAPFFILGILLNVGMGIANRVMPNMPVMFIAGPAVVVLGLILVMLSQGAILEQFIQHFADFFMDAGL